MRYDKLQNVCRLVSSVTVPASLGKQPIISDVHFSDCPFSDAKIMKRTSVVFLGSMLGTVTGVLTSWIYFRDFADIAMRKSSITFAGFGLPLLISASLGCVAAIAVSFVENGKPILARLKGNWPVFLLSSVLSYSISMFLLWLALELMDRCE